MYQIINHHNKKIEVIIESKHLIWINYLLIYCKIQVKIILQVKEALNQLRASKIILFSMLCIVKTLQILYCQMINFGEKKILQINSKFTMISIMKI